MHKSSKTNQKLNLPNQRTLRAIVEKHKLCLSGNPRGTDQSWPKSYVDKFYNTQFRRYAADNIRLIQIGAHQESSLVMWRYYLSHAEVYGWDGESEFGVCVEMTTYPQSENQHGQNAKAIMTRVSADSLMKRPFNIIIYRKATQSNRQVDAVRRFEKCLSPDEGMLVIENVGDGGLAVLPLMAATPRQFTCTFHDYRLHHLVADNCLYTIKRCREQRKVLANRLVTLTIGLAYLIVEGLATIIVKPVLSCRR